MALHAARLELIHPISKKLLNIESPLPSYWKDYWLKGLAR
jgi:hypothetical protein